MILLDLSQTAVATLHVQAGNNKNLRIDEDLIRHMILNCVRSYNVRNKERYGQLVICADDRNNWRKNEFEFYKANRAVERDASGINWAQFFEFLNLIKMEMKEFLPYPVIQVDGAEADDVIAGLVFEYGSEHVMGSEPILILSGDRDYAQLQTYANVDQYDPTHKHTVRETEADKYLYEKIIRGDSGDGVPNVFSDDNCLVIKKRQKPIYQEKMNLWLTQEPKDFLDETQLQKFNRNKLLIDLKKAPQYIREEAVKQYKEQQGKNKSKIFSYFISKKLKYLMENIQDF